MCGISAIVNVGLLSDKRKLKHDITGMINSQYHRGPDASGIWMDPELNVALAHNRLAIIDTSDNGIQPMICENARVAITYNGEIYNYLELRNQLLKLGYRFRSNTDTEVILNGYKHWGNSLFEKLNGMWGLVIYDRIKNKIVVSRDPSGMKPIYYYQSDREFIVASEVKGLLASNRLTAEVSYDGLNEYFSFQNIISNRTLFKNVFMVEPGHYLEFDIATNWVVNEKYWDLSFSPRTKFNEADFCDEVLQTFLAVSDRHLLSDVPVGASLSGGMDSSSIVATTSRVIPKINTFTGYFDHNNVEADERSVNELSDARIISDIFGTDHKERLIHSSNVIDTLPSIIWHLEDPKVGMSYTFYLLSQLISQFVTVNLSGTGGDETFGGYPWRYGLIKDVKEYDKFCDIYYQYWCRLLADDQKRLFFKRNIYNEMDANLPKKSFSDIVELQRDASPINRAIYFEFKTFLHGMLLVEDKLGMAFSLETRFPFLDREMVSLTSCIPDNYKYSNNEAKLLLKKSFKTLLPDEILTKKKQGFTPPDMSWYRNELRMYVQQLLLGPRSLISDYVNRDYITAVLEQHNSKKRDNRLLIWSLMFFEGWLRIYIDGQGKRMLNF